MMKQIIFSGAIVLTTTGLAHASCFTADEIQNFQNTSQKAESVKDQIKDDTDQHNFKAELDLYNKTLTKAKTARPGPLCNAYKQTFTSSQQRLQDLAKKSDLTLE